MSPQTPGSLLSSPSSRCPGAQVIPAAPVVPSLPSCGAAFISLHHFLSASTLNILKGQDVTLYMFGKYVTAGKVVFIQGVKYIYF